MIQRLKHSLTTTCAFLAVGFIANSPMAHAQSEDPGEALIKGILGAVVNELGKNANQQKTGGPTAPTIPTVDHADNSPFVPIIEAKTVKLKAAAFAGKQTRNRAFLFTRDKYMRLTLGSNRLDKGFPRPTGVSWPGVPANVDAATYAGHWNGRPSNRMYLFKGQYYWMWDLEFDELVEGYPRTIVADFPGLPNNLDAAVFSGANNRSYQNKLYFFKDDSYWRWDVQNGRMDQGYPKSLTRLWPGLPNSLDAAVYGGDERGTAQGKLYFFRGDVVYRWDLEKDRVDERYPSALSQPAWDSGNSAYTRFNMNNRDPFEDTSPAVTAPRQPTSPNAPIPPFEKSHFDVGARVLAYWNDSFWYPAQITAVNGGEFSVRYDGGGTATMGPYHVSKIGWGRGTEIACKYRNEIWYPAKIVSMAWPNVVVQYNDGQQEATITARCRSQYAAAGGLAADEKQY